MFVFMGFFVLFFSNFTSLEKLTKVASAISENIHNPELSKYFQNIFIMNMIKMILSKDFINITFFCHGISAIQLMVVP